MNWFLSLLLFLGLTALGLRTCSAAQEALKPTNLTNVNTDKDEDDPHISANGIQLFYTSVTKEKSAILVSRRRALTQAWPVGKPNPDLTGKADYCSVFLTPEGKFPQKIYYATNKDPGTEGKGNNFDIYYLLRQGPQSEFTSESAVLAADTPADERDPWVTPDGRLFFSRKDQDNWHVYVTSRPKGGGEFLPPLQVKVPDGFHHATLTPDGRTMYLQGPLANDRSGLFRTTFVGGKWEEPEELTALNNSQGPTGDRSPCLSRDGTLLYFASDRPGGKGGLDLWFIPTALLGKK